MSRLDWISDEDLERAIRQIREQAVNSYAQAGKRMVDNVIDPFSAAIIASTVGPNTVTDLISIQQMSSALRGMSNSLGYFHQSVLGSVAGWINHDTGYDLENHNQRIIAEVKNKHNTLSGGKIASTVQDLEKWVQAKGRDWIAYLVIVIPKRPERYRKQKSRRVYEIDGASFYEMVTGSETALQDLFNVSVEMLGLSPSFTSYCREVFEKGLPA